MTDKTKKLSQAEALQFWKGHIEAWQASGITQSQYCRQEALSLKTFTYRKRTLSLPSPGTVFHSLRIRPEEDYESSTPSLRLLIGPRYRIEVGDGFNPATLHKLIETLERI
jgi:transposase